MITLVGYLCAKPLNRRFPQVPLLVFGMFIVIGLLSILKVPYEEYRLYVNDLFSHLLGYVTVALAIPLAAMRYDDLPLKSVIGILCFASISAVALPMGLAYLLHMSEPTILAFATRSNHPNCFKHRDLITCSRDISHSHCDFIRSYWCSIFTILLKHIHDERASGLALGLAAHAIGTAQAWQRGPVAGRYAAFGMALNGVFTAIWLPTFMLSFGIH